ncbi:MAG: hypothetical protein NTX15_06895 [Candidatus Kapabacteria bacterium]|nr:hypothetical protein [Candidatus Kapabacteria bacterium]
MKLISILSIAVLAFMLVACEDGPSGPQPSQELSTLYDLPPLTGIKVEVSARMIVQGPLVIMTSIPMLNDGVSGTDIYLSTSPVNPNSTPTLRLHFAKLPTAPGTYAFSSSTVVLGTLGYAPQSDQGAFASVQGNLYAPISGSITITEVRKDASFIYGYSGYANGQLQAMWPRDFKPTTSQPLPPGFNAASPTLVGETLTLHSAPFKTRNNFAIPIGGTN